MATLPTTGENLDLINFTMVEQPSYTHKLVIERGRVSGMTDQRDALFQAIYLILNVERYAYPIYSWRYGVELAGLAFSLPFDGDTLHHRREHDFAAVLYQQFIAHGIVSTCPT